MKFRALHSQKVSSWFIHQIFTYPFPALMKSLKMEGNNSKRETSWSVVLKIVTVHAFLLN
jgi:hypothetical protein